VASRSPAVANSALQTGEASVPPLTSLLSDWVWEQDEQFRFTFLSEGLAKKTGLDPASLLGRTRWDLPANLAEGEWARHRAQLERHEPFRDLEIRRLGPGGRAVWLSVSGEPIFEADGRFKGYRGAGRDITAQKRVEELLRLGHAVARELAQATRLSEGLESALRVMCESEGWDYGRFLKVEAGALARVQDGWFAREPAVEQFLRGARVLWEEGKPVWSSAPAAGSGNFATFAFPALVHGKAIAILVFSGHAAREPDRSLLEAAPAIGSLFGQFLSRIEAEGSLRESEARFRSLTEMSSDFYWESDVQFRISQIVHGPNYPPDVLRGALGKTSWEIPSVSPDEAAWTAFRATLGAHASFRDFEFGRRMPDGSVRHFSVSGEPRFGADGAFLGYHGVGRDITEIATARERIASLAYSDPLTGLANRASLVPSLEQAVQRARRRNAKLAVVFLDLDGFKQINDLYGHDAGDALLVDLAGRLRQHLRSSDLIARLGGDEFLVVLEEVQEIAPVEVVAKKLLAEAERPYAISGHAATVTASIGISVCPDDAVDAGALMKHADMAMYAAKQAGKNTYRFYSSGPAANEPAAGATSSARG
jgi:diguanylate cyclase (GGDEF)-like protein/PAS domain S-box-containing protein